MTTTFNQEMYAKMRAKKNEHLSDLKKRVVRVVENETPITPATSVSEATRIAFSSTSVEEITPRRRRCAWSTRGKRRLIQGRPVSRTTLALQ